MDDRRINRRDAAKRFFLASASLAAPAWVLACGKGELACNDTSGLKPDEVTARNSLGYKEKAADPAKACSKCSQYEAKGEGQCGGCKVMKGPIHPDGSCNAFAPKA